MSGNTTEQATDSRAKAWTLTPMDEELLSLLESPATAEEAQDDLRQKTVEAEVVSVEEERMLLRLEDGSEAFAALDEAKLPGRELPVPGDRVPVLVEMKSGASGWKVAVGKAALLADWDVLRKVAASDAIIDGTVEYVSRAGFILSTPWGRAFLPGRESGIPRSAAGDAIGRALRARIQRLDGESGELILSRRKIADEERKRRLEEALESLEEGEAIRGIVRRVVPFGAFVEILPGVEGLLHVSEMDVERVEDPTAEVQPGDAIDVRILRIDAERGRIGLSRRQIADERRREMLEGMQTGIHVDGTVTRLVDFGAFIEIQPGVEGLCHISELSWTERVRHPSELLEEGQAVTVHIMDIDPDQQRISLSLRRTEENPWADLLDSHPVGSVAKGTITRIEDYGLFVQLAEGVEGLCHISDLVWEGRPERPSDVADFAVGDEIEVKVLELDTDRRRIRLGVKQLSGDPWEDAAELLKEGNIVPAEVVRFDDQAAWLRVAENVEGRMHISQVSTERIDSIRAALRLGQSVNVMVQRVDRERRRLDLSIRAIVEAEEANAPRSHSDDDGAMNPLAEALAASGAVKRDDD